MKIQTFSFLSGPKPDGILDSERSLVMLFGALSLWIGRPRPARCRRLSSFRPRGPASGRAANRLLFARRDLACASGHRDLHNQTMTLTTISEA